MDNKTFLENSDTWNYDQYYSMGDTHRRLLIFRNCEFLGMNKESDSERLAREEQQMDFWYYCPKRGEEDAPDNEAIYQCRVFYESVTATGLKKPEPKVKCRFR